MPSSVLSTMPTLFYKSEAELETIAPSQEHDSQSPVLLPVQRACTVGPTHET